MMSAAANSSEPARVPITIFHTIEHLWSHRSMTDEAPQRYRPILLNTLPVLHKPTGEVIHSDFAISANCRRH
ncbi:hypothetical protein CJ178_30645 [Rhodococcus sp. ACPA4]|nr:hypothetical protein CJ178_30645 [Rhodococcus sp. ACPA4]